MRILLVEPKFPIPRKSYNHKNFLPIGLLKLASYYRAKGHKIKLVRGNLTKDELRFYPDKILITSLFTYWSSFVKDSVEHYRKIFPRSKIIVGGIYASLMPDHCLSYTKCDQVHIGVHQGAERFPPAYDLIANQNPHSLDYQIIHTSRGCIRNCDFCGTWKIEPEFKCKTSIMKEITQKNIIFYDNNLLKNPHIENILNELITLKKQKKLSWCESQSGFDGRILLEKPELAPLLRQAGFRFPRIAWDWNIGQYQKIKKQLDILVEAGYRYRDIFVFMIYNWDIPFEEMEEKRIKCWEWKTQISDCRFRPLYQTSDNYKPRLIQTSEDYHIHEGWTDSSVKQFRSNVRRQNICIRQEIKFYSKCFEFMKVKKSFIRDTKKMNKREIQKLMRKKGFDYWFPEETTFPLENATKQIEKVLP